MSNSCAGKYGQSASLPAQVMLRKRRKIWWTRKGPAKVVALEETPDQWE